MQGANLNHPHSGLYFPKQIARLLFSKFYPQFFDEKEQEVCTVYFFRPKKRAYCVTWKLMDILDI